MLVKTRWTQEEVTRLKAAMAKGKKRAALNRMFPNRSWRAIRARIVRLNPSYFPEREHQPIDITRDDRRWRAMMLEGNRRYVERLIECGYALNAHLPRLSEHNASRCTVEVS